MLMEAIQLTLPRFDLNEICGRRYTTDEIRISSEAFSKYLVRE